MKWLVIGICLLAFAGCDRATGRRVQGYVDGDFVLVASPLGGRLEHLDVCRGEQTKEGAPLFVLESGREEAAKEEAVAQLAEAEATLADARLGLRPSEIESLEAQLEQAVAALDYSEKEFKRQDVLARKGVSAPQELDRARSVRDQDLKRKLRLEADLATARLGARRDQIAAAEANVKARHGALALAEWNLDQKRLRAPKTGLVFDTLYREGEWVGAGMPVVSLLPPENVSVRAYIPESWVGTVRPGQKARVVVDGRETPILGIVSYIAPRAEYTPPVIYSNEARQKLSFLARIEFPPDVAATLNPGQPVDVDFAP